MRVRLTGGAAIVGAALMACGSMPRSPAAMGSGSDDGDNRVWLVDRNNGRFDVTHAVRHYGFERQGFEYGIGKDAIPPLNHPPMLVPDDTRYPSSGMRSMEVIGAALGGEARSYRIRDLAAHEIVNDTIGHTQAAVAY